jgi:hypothetical protein
VGSAFSARWGAADAIPAGGAAEGASSLRGAERPRLAGLHPLAFPEATRRATMPVQNEQTMRLQANFLLKGATGFGA